MELSTTVLAELLAMVRKPKDRARVGAKASSQKCIHCEKAAVPGNRGLCEADYDLFKNERAAVAAAVPPLTPKEQKVGLTYAQKQRAAKKAYDDEQVAKGNILASRQGVHSKRPNPFKRTA